MVAFAPIGLVPVTNLASNLETQVGEYTFDATTAAMGINSPVQVSASNKITPATNSSNILGSFVYCNYEVDGTVFEEQFWPGNVAGAKNIEVFVTDNPSQVYRVQCNGNFALTDLQKNVNLSIPASAVDSDTGYSKVSLDIDNAATTASLQFRIIRVASFDIWAGGDPNEVGANTWVEGFVNPGKHQYAQSTGK